MQAPWVGMFVSEIALSRLYPLYVHRYYMKEFVNEQKHLNHNTILV